MQDKIPTAVLSIIKAEQIKGEKLTTLTCRMTGDFPSFTNAVIFPGEKEFQVKDIKHIETDKYSVKIKGLPYKSCVPFSVITPVNLKVQYNKRAYFFPENFHSKDFYNGDYYITGGIFDGYRHFKKDKYYAKVRKTGALYSVDFPFKTALVPGAIYRFENTKGFKGDMKLIYPGYLDKKSENYISARVEKYRSRPNVKGIYSIILRTNKFVELPYFIENEEFEGALKFKNIRIMEKEFVTASNKIVKQSKGSGGCLLETLRKSLNTDPYLFRTVLDSLVENKKVEIVDSYVVSTEANMVENLSPLAKEAYKLISESGDNGYSIRSIKNPGLESCFYETRRMRLSYSLDDDLFYTSDAYTNLVQKAFNGKKIDDKLTIQDVRNNTDLSRRYIIDLLKYLEENNFIERREEDERVIKNLP